MADRSFRRAPAGPAGPAAPAAPALEDPEEALAAVALTLHEAATLIGAYRWTEERLFALTGRWSADPAMAPEAQVRLFEASAQHAWHADLWADRLPVLDGFDREAATRPRGPVLEPVLQALDAVGEPAARLAGLARVVLPELAAAYRHHLQRAVPVTDGPVIRTLHLVLAGLDAEAAALDRVLARAGLDAEATGAAGATGATGPGAQPIGERPSAAAEAAVRRLEVVLERAGDPMVGAGPGPAGPRPGPVRLVPWPDERR